MNKILYVATSDIHLNTFHIPYLNWLVAKGNIVDLAFEDRGGVRFDMARRTYRLNFPRELNGSGLLRAYSNLREIINSGGYDLIHCHTPIPSALTRLASKQWRGRGGKVLYTAHGFHFYKGAPLKSWLIYYPAELVLSHLTDFIITINYEDLEYTRSPLWGAPSRRIPGVGIQAHGLSRASPAARQELRNNLGFAESDFILLYVAEFIPRKNHRLIIEAASELSEAIPELKVVFLGQGALLDRCRALTRQLGTQDTVLFMGFRNDVAKFAQVADVGISASKHEGLGIALLEQMRCAVPVVASDDRGHREFVEQGKTGFLFRQNSRKEFNRYIKRLYNDRELLTRTGLQAEARARDFDISRSIEEMAAIYGQFL